MELVFSTQEELYRRLYPALSAKKREFSKNNIRTIREEDIWDYLKRTKWNYSNGLSLSIMVDDILSVESEEILDFIHISDYK